MRRLSSPVPSYRFLEGRLSHPGALALTEFDAGRSFKQRNIEAWHVGQQASLSRSDETHGGHPLSPKKRDKSRVLLTAGIHPNEIVGPQLVYAWVEKLMNCHTPLCLHLRATLELVVVPFINVDAQEDLENELPELFDATVSRSKFEEDVLFQFRNNRSLGCPSGVDLNRNFSFHFVHNCTEEGGSGVVPFSEPETQSLRDLHNFYGFTTAMHLHAFGEAFMIPYNCCDGGKAPKPSPLQILSYESIREVLPEKYSLGTAPELLGYTATGELDDWLLAGSGTISGSLEVGNDADGFDPSFARIEQLAVELWPFFVDWLWLSQPRALQIKRLGESKISITDKSWSTSVDDMIYEVSVNYIDDTSAFYLQMLELEPQIGYEASVEALEDLYVTMITPSGIIFQGFLSNKEQAAKILRLSDSFELWKKVVMLSVITILVLAVLRRKLRMFTVRE